LSPQKQQQQQQQHPWKEMAVDSTWYDKNKWWCVWFCNKEEAVALSGPLTRCQVAVISVMMMRAFRR
jgi:hypothetical protein